jgi:hypothetical protein
MLIRAGASDLARTLDQRDIDAAMPKITGWAEACRPRIGCSKAFDEWGVPHAVRQNATAQLLTFGPHDKPPEDVIAPLSYRGQKSRQRLIKRLRLFQV